MGEKINDRMFDVRVIERHLGYCNLDEKDQEKFLKGLKDVAGNAHLPERPEETAAAPVSKKKKS